MTTRFSTMHALLLVAPRNFSPPLRLALLHWHTTRQHPRISAHNHRQVAAHHAPGSAQFPLTHAAAPHITGMSSFNFRPPSPRADLASARASPRACATAPTSHPPLQAGRSGRHLL